MNNRYDEYEEELDQYYNKWLAQKSRADRLENGPGGIMEMKQTIADKEHEIARLQNIVTRMGRIYKHLNPENHPGVYFIHGSLGSYDSNGMPEKLLVVPAYGVDFSYIYERTEKTTGPEW